MKENRRTFLQVSASATVATLLPFTNIAAKNSPQFPAGNGFKMLIMATDWGFTGSKDAFCAAAKKEGYDGIEVWWPGNEIKAKEELFEAVKKHGLKLGFLCGAGQSNWKEHLVTFKSNLDAITGNNYQKPVYINCHSGKDFFSFEQNNAIVEYTIRKSGETGIPIYHETHRGRMLFAAHITRQFMEKNPDLRLTLDISHWCNVHESLLGDQKETIDMALEKSEHIHARIGHAQGPQVNDPRAPEWAAAVEQHFLWWDKIIARKKQQGESLTILTEFGPPDYLPTLPYTRQPLADQWAINVYMMNLLRKRYS